MRMRVLLLLCDSVYIFTAEFRDKILSLYEGRNQNPNWLDTVKKLCDEHGRESTEHEFIDCPTELFIF